MADQTLTRGLAQAIACAALGLLLAACAGPGGGLTGNDTGGIIAFASVTQQEAGELAVAQCARYGKAAHPTGVDRRDGGYYSFACRFDPRRAD